MDLKKVADSSVQSFWSMLSPLLDKLLQRENLSQQEATWLMEKTMGGELTPVQIAAWLVAIRAKGETALEISAFATVMRANALKIPVKKHPLVDTCGTGGDKSELMNISTLSALTLASMGVAVAKHGNRAVSSKSGSADLLEQLGYPLQATPEQTAERIDKTDFGFLFAPQYHPAMKFAVPVRKELGIRTVFNILGPLSNPASAEIHLLGVFSNDLVPTMAEVLNSLGVKEALVVHSEDGLDEISPVAPTRYCFLNGGKLNEGRLEPEKIGGKISDLSALKVKDAAHALQLCRDTLSGKFKEGMTAVALNTAALLFLRSNWGNTGVTDVSGGIGRHYSAVIEHLAAGKVDEWLKGWSR